jgi:hypothetical protein
MRVKFYRAFLTEKRMRVSFLDDSLKIVPNRLTTIALQKTVDLTSTGTHSSEVE